MHPMTTSMATFETALGRCGVRWTDVGIVGVLLPSSKLDRMDGLGIDDVADAFVRPAIDGMTAVLAGEARDLRDITLDQHAIDAFRRSVYAATRDIPPGTTRSYGEVARAIGLEPPTAPARSARRWRATRRRSSSRATACSPRTAPSTASRHPGGLATKRRMLELEGAPGYGQQALFG